jgi:RPA family protein
MTPADDLNGAGFDADDWTFDGCQRRMRKATAAVIDREKDYKLAIEHSADAESVYRATVAKAFEAYRKDGKAVEESTTLARRDAAVIGRERDYAAGMVKLRGEQLENARDSRRSLWRLIEWARARDLAQACQRDRENRNNPEVAADYRARRALSARNYAKANPDTVRANQARWREKEYADPERLERRKTMNRASYARRKGFGRSWWDEPDYVPLVLGNSGLLPIGPFIAFIHDAYPAADVPELARLLKLDGSSARRIFKGQHKFLATHVIDRALTTGLGRPDLLDLLYPPGDL